MEKLFRLKENGTTVKTEVIAGITTFMTMAYILILNPDILGKAIPHTGAIFTATALSAAIATLVMALVANLPFALAPGMGLNAFFAFGVCIGMGKSWQFALTAVFLEGLIFIVLTLLNVREAIINSIPKNVKKAISVGIGLFIAFIGLQNAGIIINDNVTLVHLGKIIPAEGFSEILANGSFGPLLGILGVIIMGILLALKVKGALLIGILITTVIGIPLGVTSVEGFSLVSLPESPAPIFFQFEWSSILSLEMVLVLFTFLFVDMFDTVGTLVGVSTQAKMLNEDGSIPRAKQALMADAIGTTAGAVLGTSTVTTYVESASGVAEGGRTGLTSLVTALFFLIALLFSPLFLMVPGAATGPALVLVGLFMMAPIKEIDLKDYTEAIPAFLTIILMPLAYDISTGIMFGVLSYILLKLLSGRVKDVGIITYIIGALFLIKLFI